MRYLWVSAIAIHLIGYVSAFWDIVSTTPPPVHKFDAPRTSFFRWQWVISDIWRTFGFGKYDWHDIGLRRRLQSTAGISIDFTPLSTATLMNRRVLITSANYLDPHMKRQQDLRIWALGHGEYNTPFRYRVWRVWRILPRSMSPEHQHGPRGTHVPRHDICVIISWDQMYLYYQWPTTYAYAYRAILTDKHRTLRSPIFFSGSGFEYMEHVEENYKIFYCEVFIKDVVDCSKYLPKWWGKFICIKNVRGFPGVQNGGGLISDDRLTGLGCFEIRYNEDRIFVFTDLRYYTNWIFAYGEIHPGDYYEYAYPQWGFKGEATSMTNYPFIPFKMMRYDIYPFGK